MAIHALLVGINEYHPNSGVSSLNGCVNDVHAFHAYLSKRFPGSEEHITLLTNEQATRGAVIDAFKTRLTGNQVKDDDVVVFYYSGHGSYAPSAPEFVALGLDTRKQDETLVLYDSRLDQNFDLADKELALLLAAVNQSASIVVVLDSCHAGSATRAVHIADEIKLGLPRFTPASTRTQSRALSQYLSLDSLDYSKMPKLVIPSSKHVLLAACGRDELAYEAAEPSGLFSSSLLKVIESGSGDLTYANLYQYVYTVLKRQANKQTPQLKVYGGFDPNLRFVSREVSTGKPACQLSNNGQEWIINYGALHGMPVKEDVLQNLRVSLYGSNHQPAGSASILRTRLIESVVQPDTALLTGTLYDAEIVNQPPSLCIYVRGGAETVQAFFALQQQQQKGSAELFFHHDGQSAYDVILEVTDHQMQILDAATGRLLHGIRGVNRETIDYITGALQQIGKWKTLEQLQASQTRILEEDIQFALQIKQGGNWIDCEGFDVTLDLTKEKPEIPFRIKLVNLSATGYYVALYHLSPQFAIEKYTQDVDASLIATGETPAIECNKPDNDDPYTFYLDENTNEETEIYKLVISRDEFADYFIEQRTGLERKVLDQIPGRTKAVRKSSRADWTVKTLTVRLVKQLQRLDAGNKFSNTVLTIQPHPSFRAQVALTPIRNGAKGFNPLTILDEVFSAGNFSFLNLAPPSKGGAEQSVVELTDVAQEEALSSDPLQFNLHYKLQDDEQVMAVSFYDDLVVPIGLLEKSPDGDDHLFSLYQAPIITDARREAGKNPVRALWFCFLKVVFKRDKEVFKLSPVSFKNGRPEYSKQPVAEALQTKAHPLLVVHGIIGNTRSLMTNLEFLVTDDQYPYDIIIAFDYENLDTELESIAAILKDMLEEAGISENKKIDILTHSMGGLVSRYMIEKLDGDGLVNRLFMAGTPNNGSVFGQLATIRTWSTGILMLVCNYGKQFLGQFGPFLEACNTVLVAAAPVTHTLEQMRTGSKFLAALNKPGAKMPATKYFVVAGNTSEYIPEEESLVKKTMEKIKLAIGKLAYWHETNDIAVSVQSIRTLPAAAHATEIEVGCHHLNYFDYEKSLEVLKELMKT